jgi:hypothetical protein
MQQNSPNAAAYRTAFTRWINVHDYVHDHTVFTRNIPGFTVPPN